MSLLRRWFGGRGPQLHDSVWTDAASCLRGIESRARLDLQQGRAVLVLVRSGIDLSALAQGLETHSPTVADDRYATGDLQTTLAAPGALGISRPDALRPGAVRRPGSHAPLAVHVRARDARRSGDARLLDLLAPFMPTAIVFHHALDDELLRAHTRQLEPLLSRLGMEADQAIESPLLSRALQRAQRD